MGKVSYYTFMVYRCTSINDAMLSNLGIGLNDCALHYNRAVSNLGRRGNNRPGMNDLCVLERVFLGNEFSYLVRPDTDNQRTFDFGLGCLENRSSINLIAMRGIIIKTTNIVTMRLDDILYYLCVAACSKKINCCH